MKTIDCAGSSNVETITYDEAAAELRVTHKDNKVYAYADVPSYKVHELEAAPSKGSYIHQNIKPHHPCNRLS